MRLSPSAAFTRLVLFVAAVVLLTSRTMLLLHEFVGHGAVATVLGGRVTAWRLFLFAGGRVSYQTEGLTMNERIVISLGGIALELVLGAIAFVIARRMRARFIVAFALWWSGAVVVAHAALYLARGVHYGFGDGMLLANRLEGSRWPVVVIASAIVLGTTFVAARHLAVLPAALLTGSRWSVASKTVLVFALAGALHGALAWVEIRYFPDTTWTSIMEDASVVKARAEIARRIAEARKRGEAVPSEEEQRRMQEELERARRPFPLDPVLYGGIAVALALGLLRGGREALPGASPPCWRAIGIVGALLLAALVIIAALRSQAPTERPRGSGASRDSGYFVGPHAHPMRVHVPHTR
jgi:hypothetical protein